MHMVVFAIKLHQLRPEIGANAGENAAQIIKDFLSKSSMSTVGIPVL